MLGVTEMLLPERPLNMGRTIVSLMLATTVVVGAFSPANAGDKQVTRGAYLVELGGCDYCHTPGYFLGKIDLMPRLSGSDVGFYVTDLGIFYGGNLTPDDETGLGRWTTTEIVAALTTGTRPDERELVPVMPWRSFAKLTASDAYAIAAFLKSLPPIKSQIRDPLGPDEQPSSFTVKLVPPEVMRAK